MPSLRSELIVSRAGNLTIDGVRFPTPLSIKREFLYEKSIFPNKRSRVFKVRRNWALRVAKNVLAELKIGRPSYDYKVKYRKIPLYASALARARTRDNKLFAEQLRQYSSRFPDLSFHHVCKTLCSDEAFNLRSREENAHKVIVQSIKKEKYG